MTDVWWVILCDGCLQIVKGFWQNVETGDVLCRQCLDLHLYGAEATAAPEPQEPDTPVQLTLKF